MTADSMANAGRVDTTVNFPSIDSVKIPRQAAAEDSTKSSTEGTRPVIGKQWQTERPPGVARTPSLFLPNPTRRATNVSMLNEDTWNKPDDGQDSSSASSSSDEENTSAKAKRARHTRGDRKGIRGSYRKFNVGNDDYSTKGRVSKKDGRLNISVNETSNKGYLAKALGANFLKSLGSSSCGQVENNKSETLSRSSSASSIASDLLRPRLNIVVMVIGSRGDIQPFLKLGKELKEYGHRVRIATHPAFKDFVENDSSLEFFSVGGDPAELMAFMVKNPGLIPTMDTLKKGEVGRRRDQMAEMFEGFWRACINDTDVSNIKMEGEKIPFIADAIIANPPCFAHIHCAERLGIPLHLMFTFPYTPTQAFPHPLANIKKSNVDPGYANFMSYPLVEMMTWQGLGDLVNTFRVRTLGLEPVSTLWAPGQLYRLKVPYTYLWSPSLVPKPKDWGPEIDIAGFVFLDLASSFKPPPELSEFLRVGEPPLYIGFGSIVVDDPDAFTALIFEAVKKAGVRALVSKGWGGLGDESTPESIYMLENTPHDWLFPQVKAVIHHGGAGTTAIGLKCGKPTLIVPFFGDQQFWGAMIGEAGAGAKPIPYKELTVDKLANGIKQLLTVEANQEAQKIAKSIEDEGDGAKNAVSYFHRSLTLQGQHSMRCSILEDRVAVWTLKNTHLRLSALVAEILVEQKKVSWKQLRLIRHNEWNDFEGPGEPLTGGAIALLGTATGIAAGIGSIPFKLAKTSMRRARHEEKKKQKKSQVSNSIKASKRRFKNRSQLSRRHEKRIDSNDESTANQSSNYTAKDSIPNLYAPRKSEDKATSGPDSGKYSTEKALLGQKKDAGREQRELNATDDDDSELSDDPDDNAAEEMAQNVGMGFGETAQVIARAPMDLSLAVAQGFHNAPRLYGDTTVRRPMRITGIQSGLKAAGNEFLFGIYDGFSGLVAQPYKGVRDNGPTGFVKGIGMGLTGFVLKDLAAIFGPFGYTLKGIHKELLKNKQPTRFIRKARILQGQRDLRSIDDKDKQKIQEEVNHGWIVLQQVWAIMDEKRAQGLKGRAKVMKARILRRANGAIENVEMAEKALEAARNRESLDGVFSEQGEDLKRTKT